MGNIQEKRDLVNEVRETNLDLPVFDFADLTSTVTTVLTGQRVKLTGIVGDGIAQIKEPAIGWVKSANLRFAKGKSYTVAVSSGLLAFSQDHVFQDDGPLGNATVHLTVPEKSHTAKGNDGLDKTFVRVIYIGKDNEEHMGFVSQGPVGSTPGGADSNLQ